MPNGNKVYFWGVLVTIKIHTEQNFAEQKGVKWNPKNVCGVRILTNKGVNAANNTILWGMPTLFYCLSHFNIGCVFFFTKKWCILLSTSNNYYSFFKQKTLKMYFCIFGSRRKFIEISWLFNVSGPMVRHNRHGISISTHPSSV